MNSLMSYGSDGSDSPEEKRMDSYGMSGRNYRKPTGGGGPSHDDTNYEEVQMSLSEDSDAESKPPAKYSRDREEKRTSPKLRDSRDSSQRERRDDRADRDRHDGRDRNDDRSRNEDRCRGDRDDGRRDRDDDRRDRDDDRRDRDDDRKDKDVDRRAKDDDRRDRDDDRRDRDDDRRDRDDERADRSKNRDDKDDRNRSRDDDKHKDRYRDKDDDKRDRRDDRRPCSRDRYGSRDDRHLHDRDRRRSRSPRDNRDKDRRRSRSPRRSRSRSRERSNRGGFQRRFDRGGNRYDKSEQKISTPVVASPTEDTQNKDRFFMPGITGRFRDQIEKRKLLWQKKDQPENPTVRQAAAPSAPKLPANAPRATKVWEGTTFAQDTDGKVANKFKRLMGIKTPTEGPTRAGEVLKKQDEMFNAMEQQYEVARTTTHTMRGVGLGFSSFNR